MYLTESSKKAQSGHSAKEPLAQMTIHFGPDSNVDETQNPDYDRLLHQN